MPSKPQVGWPAPRGAKKFEFEAFLATGALLRLRLDLRRQQEMSGSEKDRLAALVIEQHCAFEQALAGSRRRYPTHEFRSFAAVVRQYADATREDEMLHRGVVSAVNGLVQYLQCERKKVPGEVLWEADRLECLLFGGYDPHFDGDEPPGL